MIKSMTGFVSHEKDIGDYIVVWELRTLNSRFLDMNTKLPEAFRSLDFDLRTIAKEYIKRGKLEIVLNVKAKSSVNLVNITDEKIHEIAQLFSRAVKIFKNDYDLKTKIDLARVLADSTYIGEQTSSALETIKDALMETYKEALERLTQVRASEGARLAEVLFGALASAEQITKEVRAYASENKEANYKRLQQKINELVEAAQVDGARMEQEVLLLSTKSDIQEEIDRLDSHYVELNKLLTTAKDPVGRRLDFLIQELNRESNTICSKSVDINIINNAVNLKILIEQMREQVQNIE